MNGLSTSSTGTVRVGVTISEPYVSQCLLRATPNSTCFSHPGSQAEPLFFILNALGLNWTVSSTHVPGCGDVHVDELGNVTGNGLSYMLYRDQIDITGNLCSMNVKRANLFGYGAPQLYTNFVLVIRKPVELPYSNVANALSPLSMNVWICFAFVFLLSLIMLAYTSKKFSVHLLIVLFMDLFTDFRGYSFKARYNQSNWFFGQMWLIFFGTFCGLYVCNYKSMTLQSSQMQMPFRSMNELASLLIEGRFIVTHWAVVCPYPTSSIPSVQSKLDIASAKFPCRTESYLPTKQPGLHGVLDKILDSDQEYVTVESDAFLLDALTSYRRAHSLIYIPILDRPPVLYYNLWRKEYHHANALRSLLAGSEMLQTNMRKRYFERVGPLQLTTSGFVGIGSNTSVELSDWYGMLLALAAIGLIGFLTLAAEILANYKMNAN